VTFVEASAAAQSALDAAAAADLRSAAAVAGVASAADEVTASNLNQASCNAALNAALSGLKALCDAGMREVLPSGG
jgi:hypothetical protein